MPLQSFSEFGWRVMTRSILQIPPSPQLLQDLIFRQQNTLASEYIDVDVIMGDKYISPFTSTSAPGTIIDKMSREVRSVQAPRIRLKKPFSAAELLSTRAPGQGFYVDGSGSLSAYRQQKLAQELQDLKNRIATTKEWMCAQALTGTLTVNQDNLMFSVDYNIPGPHKPVLSPGYKWNEAGSAIMDNIDTWANLIINAVGVGPDMAICGSNVVAALRNDPDVRDLLDNRRVESGTFNWKASSNYIGNLNGIDLYRYGMNYKDLTGTAQNFIGADKFILVATQARFSIEHAQILDLEAGEVVSQLFSKSWIEKDPSVAWILAESRPLPVPWQPEAIVYADVL